MGKIKKDRLQKGFLRFHAAVPVDGSILFILSNEYTPGNRAAFEGFLLLFNFFLPQVDGLSYRDENAEPA